MNRFATFVLELETPLHLGSGRAGMVAKSHAFVPGHLLGYAIAAALGRHNGGKPEHFQQALAEVAQAARFAPALPLDHQDTIADDWPEHPERYLASSPHVALQLETRSAVEGALFELEYLAPRHLHGPSQGTAVRLGGGLWFAQEKLGGKLWHEWLSLARLGGELKAGYGVARCVDWQERPKHIHGWAEVHADGLRLDQGARLWGAALDTLKGLSEAPLRPWTGRRYDFTRQQAGFGQRLEAAALVRLHARWSGPEPLLARPSAQTGAAWGCWEAGE
jgi:hypothetical protein